MTNFACCTQCGFHLEPGLSEKIIQCKNCQKHVVLDHAIHLAYLDIPHAQLIPKLRANLKVSTQKNDVYAITLASKDIIELIPEDLEANYYLAYSKATDLNSEQLDSFLSSDHESPSKSIETIVLHLIYHGPLNIFEAIKSYVQKKAPNYLELMRKVKEVRQKKDESSAHSQTSLFLYAEYDKLLELHQASVLIEKNGFTTWTSFKDLSPQNSMTYSNHMRRALRNAIGFFIYVSPDLFKQDHFQDLLKLAIELNKPIIIYNPDQILYDKTALFKESPREFFSLEDPFFDYLDEKLNHHLSDQKIAASIFDIDLFDEPAEGEKVVDGKTAKIINRKAAKKKVDASSQSQKPNNEKTTPLVNPTPSKKKGASALLKKNRPKPMVVLSLVVFFLIISLIVFFQSPLFTAQSSSDDLIEEVIPVSRIDVSVDDVRMRIGEQLRIEATAIPSASNVSNFLWRSSNMNVISINSMGVLQALNPGSAQIEVRSGDVSTFIRVFVQEPTPTLVRIQTIDEIDILFGTTETELLDMLPPSVLIFDSKGRSHDVELKWQLFEFNAQNPDLAPARFIVSGIFDLPFNVELDEIPAQVNTFVNVGPALKTIESLSNVLVPLGESQTLILNRLPKTVRITDSLDNSYDALIDWALPSTFNSNQAGETFTVKGNIILPEGLGTTTNNPATVEIPVTINVTNLETTEYTWQLIDDNDYLIARQYQTLRLRINADRPGLEGAGLVTFNFGLSDAYLRPGIEDVTFIINNQRFLNYGQSQVFLERTGSLEIEIALEINQATDFAKINFDISLDLDSIEYAFEVINEPISFPTDDNGVIEVSLSKGTITLPSAQLNDFIQLTGTNGAIGRIEYIEFSLLKDELKLMTNRVEPLKSPGGTVIRTPNQLPSLTFDPFSNEWLISNPLVVPNRLSVTYKLLGLEEQTKVYSTELSEFLYQEVSEFNAEWTHFGELDTLESPAKIMMVGVVVSIDNNQIYLQDRSAAQNKTMVFDIGTDISNVTRGSHIVIEINHATPDKASIVHVFADLQPDLIMLNSVSSFDSVRNNFINNLNPARYKISAGTNVTYTATHVYLQSMNSSDNLIRFSLNELLGVIKDDRVEDSIIFFTKLFPEKLPGMTFTIKGINSSNVLEIFDIDFSSIEVTDNMFNQVIAQEARRIANKFSQDINHLVRNAPIFSTTQTTISFNQNQYDSSLNVEPLSTEIDFDSLGVINLPIGINWRATSDALNHLDLNFKEVTIPLHGQPDRLLNIVADIVSSDGSNILIGSFPLIIPSLNTLLREKAINQMQKLIEEKALENGVIISGGVISKNPGNDPEVSFNIDSNELNLTLNQNLNYTIRLRNQIQVPIEIIDNEFNIKYPQFIPSINNNDIIVTVGINSIVLGHNAPNTSPAIAGMSNINLEFYKIPPYHKGVLEIALNQLEQYYALGPNEFIINLQSIENRLPLFTEVITDLPPYNGYYEWRWRSLDPSITNIDETANNVNLSGPIWNSISTIIVGDLFYVMEDNSNNAVRLTTDSTQKTLRLVRPTITQQFFEIHSKVIQEIFPMNVIRLNSGNFQESQLNSEILPETITFLDRSNQSRTYSIIWSSNIETVISSSGEISLPIAQDVTVRLTALLNGPGLEGVPASNRIATFDLIVKSKLNHFVDEIKANLNEGILTAVAIDTVLFTLPSETYFNFTNFTFTLSNEALIEIVEEDNQIKFIQKSAATGIGTLTGRIESSTTQLFNFSVNLMISPPKNEDIRVISFDILNSVTDVSVYLDVQLDYTSPEDLTYSYLHQNESLSNTNFLPLYILVEDSTKAVHAITLNWSLHSTQPTLSAIDGVIYQYQATLGEFMDAPWQLTPSSVLKDTPEMDYLIETSLFDLRVTVKDRLIDEKTTLQDRWVIVENNLTQSGIIEAILKETRILEVYVEDREFPQFFDVTSLGNELVIIEFPNNLFSTDVTDGKPSLGIFEVDWILRQDALYNQLGIRHHPFKVSVFLQVILENEIEVEN